MNLIEIELSRILVDPTFNCRGMITDDSVRELGRSLLKGQIQPILIDADGNLIAGFRRCRAAKLVGMKTLWAIVSDMPLREARLNNLAENMDRRQLSIIEEASAVKRLYREPFTEFCEEINRSKPWVSLRLSILELPDKIVKAAHSGRLTESQLRRLVTAPTSDQQARLAQQFLTETKEPEKRLRNLKNKKDLRNVLVRLAEVDASNDALKVVRWVQGQLTTDQLLESFKNGSAD